MCSSDCDCIFDEDYAEYHFYTMIEKDGCPKCGCTVVTSIGNEVSPPENWTRWNCMKCNHLIAEIDNSPMHTCWDFEDCTIA